MLIQGIYIFKSDSGITLYSKKIVNINEDILSAFLSAIKDFFKSLSLGGLSTFSSDNYIFYLASYSNVTTAIIINRENKNDVYFNLAYQISIEFFKKYESHVLSEESLFIPNVEAFDESIGHIIANLSKISQKQKELIGIFKLAKSGELEQIDFVNEMQLYNMSLFVAINFITKNIFVIEQSEANVPSRLLYLANREVNRLNQNEYRSEFKIRNISDPFDFERLITHINHVLNYELMNASV